MTIDDINEIIVLVQLMKEKNPKDEEDYGYNHFADDLIRELNQAKEQLLHNEKKI